MQPPALTPTSPSTISCRRFTSATWTWRRENNSGSDVKRSRRSVGTRTRSRLRIICYGTARKTSNTRSARVKEKARRRSTSRRCSSAARTWGTRENTSATRTTRFPTISTFTRHRSNRRSSNEKKLNNVSLRSSPITITKICGSSNFRWRTINPFRWRWLSHRDSRHRSLSRRSSTTRRSRTRSSSRSRRMLLTREVPRQLPPMRPRPR